jgi:hypothetical protein
MKNINNKTKIYKTLIVSILYWHETWPHTLQEEQIDYAWEKSADENLNLRAKI